jgi:hypothetical protein
MFLYIMLKYNLSKILGKKKFISFYKMGDWSIFVEIIVMYLCIQKHKYISKTIQMILKFYES